ncbi:MAG: diguanylate cyclase [Proteobacteria bacterium]|nr:diguanylate cyclase [Pseudomonadota bacterium]
MSKEAEQRWLRLLAKETLEVLNKAQIKGPALNMASLARLLAGRPGISDLIKEASVYDVPEKLTGENKLNYKELVDKYNVMLDNMRTSEQHCFELENAFKDLTGVLAGLAVHPEEEELNEQLRLLRTGLNQKAVPSRIEEATKALKNFVFKLDAGADPQPDAASLLPAPEGVEENVRDLLMRLVRDMAQFEDPEVQKTAKILGRKIATDFTLDDYQVYVQAISDLIFRLKEAVRREKRDLYLFTQEIMNRLEETERDLSRNLDTTRERISVAEVEFQSQVADDLQAIEKSFEAGGRSLEELRSRVFEKLANIRSRFQEKRNQDEARLKKVELEKAGVEKRLVNIHQRYQKFTKQSQNMLQELEKVRQTSLRDGLTGIFNRRAYDAQIEAALKEYKAGRLSGFSLIVFDIDYFKDFNNNYGHRAGDKVLLNVGRMAGQIIRNQDFIARYGGDEFTIILPEAKLNVAVRIAEKVRAAIAEVEFKLYRDKDLVVHVGLSMGVAEVRSGDDAASVFQRADQALYQAKEKGRNQVQTG